MFPAVVESALAARLIRVDRVNGVLVRVDKVKGVLVRAMVRVNTGYRRKTGHDHWMVDEKYL